MFLVAGFTIISYYVGITYNNIIQYQVNTVSIDTSLPLTPSDRQYDVIIYNYLQFIVYR